MTLLPHQFELILAGFYLFSAALTGIAILVRWLMEGHDK